MSFLNSWKDSLMKEEFDSYVTQAKKLRVKGKGK